MRSRSITRTQQTATHLDRGHRGGKGEACRAGGVALTQHHTHPAGGHPPRQGAQGGEGSRAHMRGGTRPGQGSHARTIPIPLLRRSSCRSVRLAARASARALAPWSPRLFLKAGGGTGEGGGGRGCDCASWSPMQFMGQEGRGRATGALVTLAIHKGGAAPPPPHTHPTMQDSTPRTVPG